jgi:hypothetical protein
MRHRVARIVAAAALSALALAGCGTTEVPAIRASITQDGGSSHPFRRVQCVLAILYIVDGDLFTFRGGATSKVGQGDTGGFGGGTGGGAGSAPSLGMSFGLDGYDGHAALLWGGATVDAFDFDKTFIEAGETEVLSYDAPDGTRSEFHIYGGSATQCASFPPATTLTREEVEALES